MDRNYYHYWGKNTLTEQGEYSYHLLPYHCLDVGAVGEQFLRQTPDLLSNIASFLELEKEETLKLLVFFLILHDLGKYANAFQCLIPFKHYAQVSRRGYNGADFRHDRLSLHFWNKNKLKITREICAIGNEELKQRDLMKAADCLGVLVDAALGHHGKPISKESPDFLNDYLTSHDEIAVSEFIDDLLVMLAPRISIANLLSKDFKQRLQQISWHIAGWAVIMDWLGSDASFFAYKTQIVSLEEYWQHALVLAEKILIERDFINHFDVVPFSSVLETFGFQPTPLQQWAEMVEIDATPQLFILEDMTGAGKTEAALTLVHRLMQEGGARGFYFGLPTMATSNAMFSRISEHYLNMLNTEQGKKPSIVLAHSAKNLSEKFQEAILNSEYADHNYERNDFTATAQCNVWLADSNKKALLAPVGVGTIDQALLAVLPRRHQSVQVPCMHRDKPNSARSYALRTAGSLYAQG